MPTPIVRMNFRRADLLCGSCDLIYPNSLDSTWECDRVPVQQYAAESRARDRPRGWGGHLKLCLSLCCVTTASKVTAIQHTRTRYAGVSRLLATLTSCHNDQRNRAPIGSVKVQQD
jgi:hypothetical protein